MNLKSQLRVSPIEVLRAIAEFWRLNPEDEDVWDDPYVFRVDPYVFRVDRKPNRHIAFGVGEHYCAGAHVARLELNVIFEHLLPRLDEIEIAGPVRRLRSHLIGGVKQLPIRYQLKPAAS